MKVARAKLREIGPDDVDMEEYKVRDQRAARGTEMIHVSLTRDA